MRVQTPEGTRTGGMPSASPPTFSFPKGDLAGERRLARDPLLDRAPLMRAQHAEHVFGGARRPIVFVSGALNR